MTELFGAFSPEVDPSPIPVTARAKLRHGIEELDGKLDKARKVIEVQGSSPRGLAIWPPPGYGTMPSRRAIRITSILVRHV